MKTNVEHTDRAPAAAGRFYPEQPERLKYELNALFESAAPKKLQHVRAIISPHAGYAFSGQVAASVFNQIDGERSYRHVFLLASSHYENIHGASVYCSGDFLMPFGRIRVDTDFGKRLVEEHPGVFTDNPRPHLLEHGLEVQLPFLDYVLDNDYSIVPIVLGAPDHVLCETIASILKPYFNEKNLFIVSSDFCHYPDSTDAKKVDAETKDAILSNDPDVLRDTLRRHAHEGIPGLVTSLCGWTSVLTLLYLTHEHSELEYHAIVYRNSADAPHYENSEQVVGYWGLAVAEKTPT